MAGLAIAGYSGSIILGVSTKVQTVGIINPDGGKSVWLVPDDISEFLAKYSSQKIEGLKFYRFTSWKDAATFLAAVNEHQELMIRNLAVNIQKLTKRVGILERTRAPATAYPVNRRIEALEKKVREMSDGGYR
jgi:hypothetical protein